MIKLILNFNVQEMNTPELYKNIRKKQLKQINIEKNQKNK